MGKRLGLPPQATIGNSNRVEMLTRLKSQLAGLGLLTALAPESWASVVWGHGVNIGGCERGVSSRRSEIVNHWSIACQDPVLYFFAVSSLSEPICLFILILVFYSTRKMTVSNGNSYSTTFDNRVGGTPITRDNVDPYKVSEHILCAPRKLRIGCIGAGASGIMMCYKKEKEFGDSIDLVVYESE
jgi:hypothetical protein